MLLLLTAAWADCPRPSTTPMLVGAVVQGELAFQAGDEMGLNNAAAAGRSHLACLGDPIGMREVAAVYRLWGYAAFVEGDESSAVTWFEAAKDLEPDYMLPTAVIPPFHPMRRMYDEVEVPPPPSQGVLEPEEGYQTRVNGVVTTVYGRGRPWILQEVGPDGAILRTSLVGSASNPPRLLGPEKEPVPWDLSVLGNAGVWIRQGRLSGTLGPAARVGLPLAGAVGLDGRVAFGFSTVKEGLVLVPELRAGIAWTLESDVRPRFGGSLLVTSHGDAPFAPGAVLTAGAQPGPLDVDLQLGWSGGLVFGVAAGVPLR